MKGISIQLISTEDCNFRAMSEMDRDHSMQVYQQFWPHIVAVIEVEGEFIEIIL